MDIKLDTINILLISAIFAAIILLPIINRKKPFPWKAIFWGCAIAVVSKIGIVLVNIIFLKMVNKPIASYDFKPLTIFLI